MKNKVILFISPCLSFAGAEKVLCWLAEELANDNYEVHVLNLNLSNNNIDYVRKLDDKVIVHTLTQRSIKGLNNIIRVHSICKLTKKISADCLLSFTRYPCVLTCLAGLLTRTKTIISERGDPYQYSKGIRNKIDFFIMNRATGCVFQTHHAAVLYGKKLIEKSIVIPNPVFIKKDYQRKEKNDNVVISLGRIDNNQKRLDVAIKGFAMFANENPNYKMFIYGKGKDEKYVESLINNLHMNNSIIMSGFVENSDEVFLKGGLFLLTSDFEGMPNALLEAMAFGLPVISTDFSPGSVREIIDDHVNGIIIEKDNPKSVYMALKEYSTKKDLKTKCSENAKKVMFDYSPEIIYKCWDMYIKERIN